MRTLEATIRTTASAQPVAAQTVVALPQSDMDPAADKVRVYANGWLVLRDIDPVLEQP